MELDFLDQLDNRVEALLKQLQHLQREKEQLIKRLAQSELHFGEASARLRESDELRASIKMAIESILTRFDALNLDY
ncbi:MAG: hypothetical protein JO189_27335 [Deltaproteobacteria bacterium]|nr:hypothetical protein [Deltaproteobacteria bacterium]